MKRFISVFPMYSLTLQDFFSLCRSRSLGTTTYDFEKDNQLIRRSLQNIYLSYNYDL